MMQKNKLARRALLKSAVILPFAAPIVFAGQSSLLSGPNHSKRARVKISCNLYSFNEALRSGRMTLEEVLEFCAELGFDAVDPTAYYFRIIPSCPQTMTPTASSAVLFNSALTSAARACETTSRCPTTRGGKLKWNW
ncbi:MAG: hypothetical protein WKF30_16580 [Pyrinomonadaceae bacterium]